MNELIPLAAGLATILAYYAWKHITNKRVSESLIVSNIQLYKRSNGEFVEFSIRNTTDNSLYIKPNLLAAAAPMRVEWRDQVTNKNGFEMMAGKVRRASKPKNTVVFGQDKPILIKPGKQVKLIVKPAFPEIPGRGDNMTVDLHWGDKPGKVKNKWGHNVIVDNIFTSHPDYSTTGLSSQDLAYGLIDVVEC